MQLNSYLVFDCEVSIAFHQQPENFTEGSNHSLFRLLDQHFNVAFYAIRIKLVMMQVFYLPVDSITKCKSRCHTVYVSSVDVHFSFQKFLHDFDIEVETRD
jgi:hypothetical protein